jgi:hypothetical protein
MPARWDCTPGKLDCTQERLDYKPVTSGCKPERSDCMPDWWDCTPATWASTQDCNKFSKLSNRNKNLIGSLQTLWDYRQARSGCTPANPRLLEKHTYCTHQP